MNTETTIAAMHRFGGGFARAMAQAWWAADAQNRARLETAFADLFLRYRSMAELLGEHDAMRFDEFTTRAELGTAAQRREYILDMIEPRESASPGDIRAVLDGSQRRDNAGNDFEREL